MISVVAVMGSLPVLEPISKLCERRRDKAKMDEKAECTRQYMSILSPFSTPYRQAQQF
jgi:hypothetical protein